MKKRRKKNNSIFKIVLILLLMLLIVYIGDKFTGNNINNFINSIVNNQLIKKNPDSLIIAVQSNKDQTITLPLITYNKININWGDGIDEEYLTYKVNNDSDTNSNANKNNTDATYNVYKDILMPIHTYKKKGIYTVIITGDTNRGFFGSFKNISQNKYDIDVFKKEFFNNIPVSTELEYEDINNHIDKYIKINKENNIDIQNIINFKNLNFKGLGDLTKYIEGDMNPSWIEEFTNMEVFIETFASSNIKEIPDNIFTLSPNVRILSGTFFACNKLESIPNDLIMNLNKIENIRYCFSNSTNITGVAPNWWETMTNIKDNTNVKALPYSLCFNGCRKLENYNDIPFLWGGILSN